MISAAIVWALAADPDLTPAWFALLLQGGSFAVLVYMIVWGVPKLRKEIASERKVELDNYLTDSRNQRVEFKDALEKSQIVFKQESAAERAACEKHFATLAEAMGKGNEATITAVRTMAEQVQSHAARNQQWSQLLQAEVERTKAAKEEGKR